MLLSARFLLILSNGSRFASIPLEERCRREGDEAGLEIGKYLQACSPGLGGKRKGGARWLRREEGKALISKVFDSNIFPPPPSLQTHASLLEV